LPGQSTPCSSYTVYRSLCGRPFFLSRPPSSLRQEPEHEPSMPPAVYPRPSSSPYISSDISFLFIVLLFLYARGPSEHPVSLSPWSAVIQSLSLALPLFYDVPLHACFFFLLRLHATRRRSCPSPLKGSILCPPITVYFPAEPDPHSQDTPLTKFPSFAAFGAKRFRRGTSFSPEGSTRRLFLSGRLPFLLFLPDLDDSTPQDRSFFFPEQHSFSFP